MKVYRTIFEAQCVLANKKNQKDFVIVLTENGWFKVVKDIPDGWTSQDKRIFENTACN